jgi:thiol-disulfide isomerase/thioredoxin
VARAVVGDETLLALDSSQPCHLLNSAATMVWQRFDGELDLATIAEDIARACAADPGVVKGDVLDLTRQLGRLGVFENVAGVERVETTATPFEAGELGEFELPDLSGQLRSWAGFRGHSVLLVNWSPFCPYCREVAPQLGELKDSLERRGIELVFLTHGTSDQNQSLLASADLAGVLALRRQASTDPLPLLGTPAALMFAEDGSLTRPIAYGASDVADLAHRLAGAPPHSETAAKPVYLSAGLGLCPPDSARSGPVPAGGASWGEWGVATYQFGQIRTGVGFNRMETEAILDRLLPTARVDDAGPPASYSVALFPTEVDWARRNLNLLTRAGRQIVRSRSPGRVLRALVGCLSADVYQPDPRFLLVDGVGVVHDGEGYILPSILYDMFPQVQPRLNRMGLQIVDLPVVWVDAGAAELVVIQPQLPHDRGVFEEVDRDARIGSELGAVGPGRYPLKRWVIAVRRPQGVLSAATSAALAMESIALVPTLQSVLDDLVTLFARVEGFASAIETAHSFLNRLPVALGWD